MKLSKCLTVNPSDSSRLQSFCLDLTCLTPAFTVKTTTSTTNVQKCLSNQALCELLSTKQMRSHSHGHVTSSFEISLVIPLGSLAAVVRRGNKGQVPHMDKGMLHEQSLV